MNNTSNTNKSKLELVTEKLQVITTAINTVKELSKNRRSLLKISGELEPLHIDRNGAVLIREVNLKDKSESKSFFKVQLGDSSVTVKYGRFKKGRFHYSRQNVFVLNK
jgi:hypothetical protein